MASGLTAAFLSGEWSAHGMEASALAAMGGKKVPRWLRNLVAEILGQVKTPYAPSPRRLERLIRDSDSLYALSAVRANPPALANLVALRLDRRLGGLA